MAKHAPRFLGIVNDARKRIKELRKEGELKSFKKEVAQPDRDEVVTAGLKRAKTLAREMKQLAQTPKEIATRAASEFALEGTLGRSPLIAARHGQPP